jgi:hypothetical protein
VVGRRTAPYVKGTFEQVRVRRDKVVELTLEGYDVKAIAEALSTTRAVVTNDRAAMRHKLEGVPKKTWRSPRPLRPPQPFDWRHNQPAEVPGYARTTPMRGVESMYEQLISSNAMNRLAHNIDAARADGNARWLTRNAAIIERSLDYLQGMLELFADDDARQQAASSLRARDDLTTRSLDTSYQAQPLPAKGAGVLPSVTFAWVWRYWMAGIPFDDTVVTAIAAKMNITPGRAERAIREFQERYSEEGGAHG